MTEFGGSERKLKQGIVARTSAELARDGVRSPDGNPVDGHDQLTPSELLGVSIRAGNATNDLRTLAPDPALDPISQRPADTEKAEDFFDAS